MKMSHFICMCAGVLLLCTVSASAAHYFWTGAGGDDNWANLNNWLDNGTSTNWKWDTKGGTIPTSLPTTSDNVRIDWLPDSAAYPPPAYSPVVKAGTTGYGSTVCVGRGFYHPGFGQLDVYGTLTTASSGDLQIGQHGSTYVSEGLVNVHNGGVITIGRYLDLAMRQVGTLNIYEGGKVFVTAGTGAIRMGAESSAAVGVLNLWGELEGKSLSINSSGSHVIKIGTTGVLKLAGDHTALIEGYVANDYIMGMDEGWGIRYDYGQTHSGKTTVRAYESISNRKPENREVVNLTFFDRLEWTVPAPHESGSTVSVDIYLGTNPDDLTKIVSKQAVESYIFAENEIDPDTVYYWFIDVYDSAIDGGTVPYYSSSLWYFDTSGKPPVVNAGQNIETWWQRVFQLHGSAMSHRPSAVTWTILEQPDSVNHPAQISNPNRLNPQVTVTSPGVYTLQLDAVDDEAAAGDADTMQIIVYADIFPDGKIDLEDLVVFASNWLVESSDNPADIVPDGKIDLKDFAVLASQWQLEYDRQNFNPDAPYVIFEDDYDSDSDGPAALSMLLELEAAGECRIIACGTSELHEDSTATMAASLHYFGRGDIPLGSYRDDLWPYDPATTQLYDESLFCQYMAADAFNYGHTRYETRDYSCAVEVYANALNALPPGAKAKIIVTGGQTNLRTLLEQHPQLVRDRVSELHFMGCMINPDDPEEKWQMDSNVSNTDPFAAKYVAENWPTEIPVYIADTYLGLGVRFCRPDLRAQLSDLHPANRIHLLYRLWWDRGHGNALDLMSVITAVRGFTNLNGVDIIKVRGTLEINGDSSSSHYGRHRFISSPDGPHTLLRRVRDTTTAEKLSDYIDDILLLRGGDAGDGVFRDEFVVPMSDASETLQTRRGWTKAGAADSNTLIEAGAKFNESSRYVQFNGNSNTSPYNVQVKDFGSQDARVRARMMVTQSDGYVGLCVRSEGGGTNARGLNLRIQPSSPGLGLYNNDTALSQTRTYGPATVFAINTWYTLELQVEGNQLVGRLYDDDEGRTIIEQVEFTLSSVDDRRWAGMIARDKGERANWFQSGVRQLVGF